jgi:gliding motility-associated-like protein
VCRGAGGQAIPGYILPNQVDPNSSSTFTINPETGDITWDSPTLIGEYNISFLIEEWRSGIRIGYVTRDMQITIVSCTNKAPSIVPIPDTCVEAGDTIHFQVVATDPDNDRMVLTSTGSPFLVSESPAEFAIVRDTFGYIKGNFSWATTCSHIKRNPYQVFFKTVDQSAEVNLFDIKNMHIRVVGPKTRNLAATPLGKNIRLSWSPNRCNNALSYKIYRRNGFYGFVPGKCETGVPAYTGYKLIHEVAAPDTIFTDGDQVPGLANGVDYCYMVVAVYPDGAESYASEEVCVRLKKDIAVITNVSILKTSSFEGEVYLAWSKPTEIDTIQAPGPYKYLIYRANNLLGQNMTLIDSLNSLDDTTFLDHGVNTLDNPVSYRIDLYNDSTELRFLIGPSQVTSSVFIVPEPKDKKVIIRFNFSVPWMNTSFVIYRLNNLTQAFDSIGTTNQTFYADSGLINGQSYCYKVKSTGSYFTPGITDPLINFSQETCSIPADNESPCPPELTVEPDCDKSSNILRWSNPNLSCASDVKGYYIYFRPPLMPELVLLDSISGASVTTYTHNLHSSIAGCYTVRAIDSTGNISIMSDTVCIDSDTCGGYHLPNVFSPNSDNFNDLFIPYPFSSVEKIDLQIFNRWGRLVFKTSDPLINWDGKVLGTNQEAPEGVYYYVCDVYEIKLEGTFKRTIRGSVTIIR